MDGSNCLNVMYHRRWDAKYIPDQRPAEQRVDRPASQGNGVLMMRAAAANATITPHKLQNNVTVLEGSGGNIGVLTGKDGKLLVDAGITASRPRIMNMLNALSDDPIKHFINSHWHFDHADGNTWLNGEGAQILAQKKHAETSFDATTCRRLGFYIPAHTGGRSSEGDFLRAQSDAS